MVSLARGPCAWSVVTGGCSPLRGLRTSPARLSDRPAVGGAWLRPGKRRFWGRSFRLLHLISDAGVQVSVRRLLLGQAGTAGARQRPDTEGAPVSSTAVHLRLVSVSPPPALTCLRPPPPDSRHPGAPWGSGKCGVLAEATQRGVTGLHPGVSDSSSVGVRVAVPAAVLRGQKACCGSQAQGGRSRGSPGAVLWFMSRPAVRALSWEPGMWFRTFENPASSHVQSFRGLGSRPRGPPGDLSSRGLWRGQRCGCPGVWSSGGGGETARVF